jgi:hypothetical protein
VTKKKKNKKNHKNLTENQTESSLEFQSITDYFEEYLCETEKR